MPEFPIREYSIQPMIEQVLRFEERYSLGSVTFFDGYKKGTLPESIPADDAMEWYELLASITQLGTEERKASAPHSYQRVVRPPESSEQISEDRLAA